MLVIHTYTVILVFGFQADGSLNEEQIAGKSETVGLKNT